MWWILLILAVVAVAFYYRVPLLAKLLGQPEDRIRRSLERRKGGGH